MWLHTTRRRYFIGLSSESEGRKQKGVMLIRGWFVSPLLLSLLFSALLQDGHAWITC